MEKGFRTFQCPGCPAKLRFPVSEKDYGTTRIVRCPKCSTKGRIEIPRPASETPTTRRPPSSPLGDTSLFPWLDDIFKTGKT